MKKEGDEAVEEEVMEEEVLGDGEKEEVLGRGVKSKQ